MGWLRVEIKTKIMQTVYTTPFKFGNRVFLAHIKARRFINYKNLLFKKCYVCFVSLSWRNQFTSQLSLYMKHAAHLFVGVHKVDLATDGFTFYRHGPLFT